jgi:hypothetical protein
VKWGIFYTFALLTAAFAGALLRCGRVFRGKIHGGGTNAKHFAQREALGKRKKVLERALAWIRVFAAKAADWVIPAKMRGIKRRYFLMPPLSPADFTELGFDQPGENMTPVEAPKAVPELVIETTPNHFQHKIRVLNPLNRKITKPDSVHGISYAWQVGGVKPASGENLPKSRFNRKTSMIIGPYGTRKWHDGLLRRMLRKQFGQQGAVVKG